MRRRVLLSKPIRVELKAADRNTPRVNGNCDRFQECNGSRTDLVEDTQISRVHIASSEPSSSVGIVTVL